MSCTTGRLVDLTSVAGTTDAVVSTVSELPAECIACDAGCGRKNPALVCQGCLSFYYCSRRCQKKHWKRHKSRCRSIALHIDELKQATSDALSVIDSAKECRLSRNAECIICFEELEEKEDRELVILDPCGHGFCAPCLMKWQREPLTTHSPSSSTQKACPICRANVDDVEEELIQRARRCLALMQQRGLADPIRKSLSDRCQKAIEKLQLMEGAVATDVRTKLYTLMWKALNGRYDATECEDFENQHNEYNDITANMDRLLEAASFFEIHGLDEQAYAIYSDLSATLHELGFPPKHWRGEASSMAKMVEGLYFMTQKRYAEAIPLFESIQRRLSAADVIWSRYHNLGQEIHMQSMLALSRCHLMVDQFEQSISAARCILPEGRHLPGVYSNKALSHLELGDIATALLDMNRAVLYEAPWDAVLQAKNLEMYNEILHLHQETPYEISEIDEDSIAERDDI